MYQNGKPWKVYWGWKLYHKHLLNTVLAPLGFGTAPPPPLQREPKPWILSQWQEKKSDRGDIDDDIWLEGHLITKSEALECHISFDIYLSARFECSCQFVFFLPSSAETIYFILLVLFSFIIFRCVQLSKEKKERKHTNPPLLETGQQRQGREPAASV